MLRPANELSRSTVPVCNPLAFASRHGQTEGVAGGFNLGDFIREQRQLAQMSLRQLARLAGVSNPYLSQIERGLRRPSAEILQQIARGLRISAEALYVRAGILDERIADGAVVDAVLSDATLLERQKQILLEIYDAFRKENAARRAAGERTSPEAEPFSVDDTPTTEAFTGLVDDLESDDPSPPTETRPSPQQPPAARPAAPQRVPKATHPPKGES